MRGKPLRYRPAVRLLNGIWGCYLLFNEYAEFDDDDLDEEEAEQSRERLFFEHVRREAGNAKKRLL